MSTRGIAPVIGMVLMLVIVIALAGAVLVVVSFTPPSDVPQATIDGTIDVDDPAITLEHLRGDSLDVDRVEMHIRVDGEPLRHQPPLPHRNPAGYRGFPSGPFNGNSNDQRWEPGETGTILIEEDNEPLPTADSRVVVRISVDGVPVSETELAHAT